MKKTIFRRVLLRFIHGIVLTVLVLITSVCFLRNIGSLILLLGSAAGLEDAEITQFATIFEQLKTASLGLPCFLTGILCLALGWIGCRIARGSAVTETVPRYKGFRTAAAILLWIIMVLPLFVLTLWFTNVNGIRFGTVLRVLFSIIQADIF